jgi:hypothetical protein
MKTLSPTTALRHVYHSVYLQMLFGGVMAFLIPTITDRTEILPGIDARGTGGMMLFMGINVYCYLRRYEKALAANIPNGSNVAEQGTEADGGGLGVE